MRKEKKVRSAHVPKVVSFGADGVNLLGRGLDSVGIRVGGMSQDGALRRARKKTRLSDFGDERFYVLFRGWMEAVEREKRLSLLGRILTRKLTADGLVNRLLTTDLLKEHPEILDTPVRRPIVIATLPRTGSTLLHNLLAQDTRARSLFPWESMMPALPRRSWGRDPDPRLRRAERVARLIKVLVPKGNVIHAVNPNEPAECQILLRNSFFLAASVTGYREWLMSQPLESVVIAYEEYCQQLQLLQWQRPCPGHWVLKSPIHVAAMDILLEAIPDASVIQLHRDPGQVVPSLCSMATVFEAFFLNKGNRDAVVQNVVKSCVDGLRRADEAHQRTTPGSILDVDYKQLVRDPVATVREIYDHFGYEYTPEFESSLKQWLKDNPQAKHGKHRYSLEQFGLSREMMEEAFGWYYERYGVQCESV